MNAPNHFISNFDGAKIAVYRKTGKPSNKSILFIHGNSLSSAIFEKQFNAPVLADYNLFAFDFPGHGESENAIKPDEVYSVRGLVQTLEHVITSLKLKNAILVANSLGADLVLNSTQISQWENSLLTFSHAPLSVMTDLYEAIQPSPMYAFFYNANWTKENIVTIAHELTSEQDSGVELKTVLARVDSEFRRVFSATMQQGMLRDEYKVIEEFKTPVCVCWGQNERLLKKSYYDNRSKLNFWNSELQIIENGSHLLCLDSSEKFNHVILNFISSI